jgi:hypothetical protein
MTGGNNEFYGFAYGEDVEVPNGRSLGFRLLAPAGPESWSAEVEALARQLQATPYPDQWPATDLFCSVLLQDGRRLVAMARYGLADHTPSQRRGGLELIGVVGPLELSVQEALGIYRWLQQRRAQTDELRALGGRFTLEDILPGGWLDTDRNSATESTEHTGNQATVHSVGSVARSSLVSPIPVLPIRIWQEGALLFAATAPSDPDHRLGLLEQAADNWQWLPLIGEDFPIQVFANRGPVVAWTPHLAGVAVKLGMKEEGGRLKDEKNRSSTRLSSFILHPSSFATMAVLLLLLLAGNLWALISLGAGSSLLGLNRHSTLAANQSEESQERLASALLAVIVENGNWPDSDQTQKQFIAQYDRMILKHPELQLRETNSKAAVGGVGVLLVQRKRNAEQVKKMIERALADKEFNDRLSKSIADKVYQQLLTEMKE